jgi:hypothetical protein
MGNEQHCWQLLDGLVESSHKGFFETLLTIISIDSKGAITTYHVHLPLRTSRHVVWINQLKRLGIPVMQS